MVLWPIIFIQEEFMLRSLIFFISAFILFAVSPLFAMDKININKATVQELEQLKGVGPKIAQKIVDYREKSGPFKKPEDITLVQGIGPKILEENKELISVGEDAVGGGAASAPAAAPVSEKAKDITKAK